MFVEFRLRSPRPSVACRPAIVQLETRTVPSSMGTQLGPRLLGSLIVTQIALAKKLKGAFDAYSSGHSTEAKLQSSINAVFKLQKQLDRAAIKIIGASDDTNPRLTQYIDNYKSFRKGLILLGKDAQDAIRASHSRF